MSCCDSPQSVAAVCLAGTVDLEESCSFALGVGHMGAAEIEAARPLCAPAVLGSRPYSRSALHLNFPDVAGVVAGIVWLGARFALLVCHPGLRDLDVEADSLGSACTP